MYKFYSREVAMKARLMERIGFIEDLVIKIEIRNKILLYKFFFPLSFFELKSLQDCSSLVLGYPCGFEYLSTPALCFEVEGAILDMVVEELKPIVENPVGHYLLQKKRIELTKCWNLN